MAIGAMAVRAREIKSGLRVDLGMESPGVWRWFWVEISGELWGFGNIVFLGGVSISVYVAAFVGYISVAAVTAT